MDEIAEDFYLALKIVQSDIGLKKSILAQADMNEESRKAIVRSIKYSEMLLTKYGKYLKEEVE